MMGDSEKILRINRENNSELVTILVQSGEICIYMYIILEILGGLELLECEWC